MCAHTSMCACTHVSALMCVQMQMCARVCGDQKMTLDIMLQILSITLILRHDHSLAWLASKPRVPPVSASAVLGWQVCSTTLGVPSRGWTQVLILAEQALSHLYNPKTNADPQIKNSLTVTLYFSIFKLRNVLKYTNVMFLVKLLSNHFRIHWDFPDQVLLPWI